MRTRGLCQTCHRTADRRVKAGKVTDDQLVELGCWLPKRPAGPESVFGKHLETLLSK
jgi:hypothetical protein